MGRVVELGVVTNGNARAANVTISNETMSKIFFIHYKFMKLIIELFQFVNLAIISQL